MRFHVSNTLNYKNGFMMPSVPRVSCGGERLSYNQISEDELNELANKMPTLTYGQAKQAPPETFVPAHVAFDKKVLQFDAYFKETVVESQQEHYRVRPVYVFYYLEDDTISIREPKVENAGFPQGDFLRRQRCPMDDQGNDWHWRFLNIAQDFVVYGRCFRLTNCDKFTREYLTAEGIIVNDAEAIPDDPYTVGRRKPPQQYVTKSTWDSRKRFLELDRKVLRFWAVWDDRDQMFGELRPFLIHYFLVDDTMEVRECPKHNDGHDPFPVLIKRARCPKDRNDVKSTFPAIALELTAHEIKDWITPLYFKIGSTILIYGRRFLVYNMDDFTKNYYRKCYNITDFTPLDVTVAQPKLPEKFIPPYNGWGTLEDSLQNCMSFMPQPPKADFVKALEYNQAQLRYLLRMVSPRPEHAKRTFILTYRLADDLLSMYEHTHRNAGVIGGKYLRPCRIPKPGTDPQNPIYYSPADFAIGAVVKFFEHRFEIINCDRHVLERLEKDPHFWPKATLDSIRQLHSKTDPMQDITEEEKQAALKEDAVKPTASKTGF